MSTIDPTKPKPQPSPIYHSLHEGHYGAAAIEGALFLAGRVPVAHTAAEGVATALNTLYCADAVVAYGKAGKKIEELETLKASKAPKKELEQ